MRRSSRPAHDAPNLLSRLHARWGSALGELDPALFRSKRQIVLDASRAAFHELELPGEKDSR